MPELQARGYHIFRQFLSSFCFIIMANVIATLCATYSWCNKAYFKDFQWWAIVRGGREGRDRKWRGFKRAWPITFSVPFARFTLLFQ